MAKSKIKVKVQPGKNNGGTTLARSEIRVVRTSGKPRVTGKAIWQTNVQMNVHLLNKNGQARRRYR